MTLVHLTRLAHAAAMVVVVLSVFEPALRADSKIEIFDGTISVDQVRDGEKVILRYQINSYGEADVWLGARLISPSGASTIEPETEREQVRVGVGTGWYEREFVVNLPGNAEAGFWNLELSVREGSLPVSIYRSPRSVPVAVSDAARVPILVYHKVAPVSYGYWWVTTQSFAEQMCALKTNGYTAVSFDDLIRYRLGQARPPLKPVIITFDDGYEDLYTEVFPIISSRQIDFRITSFIPTARIGGTNDAWDKRTNFSVEPVARHLNWDQIVEMQKSGYVDFESHSATHAHLGVLEPDAVLRELRDSSEEIERRLGRRSRVHAYPYYEGWQKPTVRDSLMEAGYYLAVADFSRVEPDAASKFWLSRIEMTPAVSIDNDYFRQDDFLFGIRYLDDPKALQHNVQCRGFQVTPKAPPPPPAPPPPTRRRGVQ